MDRSRWNRPRGSALRPPLALLPLLLLVGCGGHPRLAPTLSTPTATRAARPAPRPRAPLRLPEQLPHRVVRLPILMYHRIDYLRPSLPAITLRLTVDPRTFTAQMRWLADHRFHAITQLQLFDALTRGASLPPHPVMVTFDDGYRDVLGKAAPTLERLRMPATAYVITDRISAGDPSFLTWPELRTLERDRIEIGSHTVTHRDLPSLDDTAALAELANSRRVLEQRLGHPVQWLAYPAGRQDQRIVALAHRTGYVLAVTTRPGSDQRADDPLELHRYEVLDTTSLAALASFVQ
jgi:peptidoglycan/xylan/chitin deacetylase (PgdA/CDA1 family)